MDQPFAKSKMLVVVVVFVSLLPNLIQSQTIWVSPRHHIAIEALKPNFDGPDNTNFITSTIFVTGRLPILTGMAIVGELPFVHSKSDFRTTSENQAGNPYVGLEFRRENFPLFTEIGVRLPVLTKDNFATFVGFFSDVDRLEAFIQDAMAIQGFANFYHQKENQLTIRLRGGASVVLDTKNNVDPDIFLLFGGQLGWTIEKLELLGGITGRFRFTEDGQLGQRGYVQLGLVASIGLGAFRPGAHFKLPLEPDLLEIIAWVAGVNLGIKL